MPELEDTNLDRLDFAALPDGTLRLDTDVIPAAALDRLAAALDPLLERPYSARAVRRGRLEWAVGARRFRWEALTLDPLLGATSLEVAVAPDGERSARVDGEELVDDPGEKVERALAEVERRGRDRFQSFVARADKVGGARWDLTIDPL